ncbi:MAG: ATP-dependent sacrificial sulfur transferase LarE [Methanobacteriaceae archaeon]|nr:ATP-dependent sacrificial sulfur transferase LarE [Methanobacteriaceae archaeon]
MELQQKLDKVKDYLKDKKVVVAFSGGADSTLLAKLAFESAPEAVAVTVDGGVLPKNFKDKARKIAGEIGIPHVVLSENFLKDELFRSNPPQRCYICKNKMYTILEQYTKDKGFDAIADGTNISDLLEDRPGMMVNYEKNISTPLVYAGLTAEEVRETLKHLNLDYSQSTTCYATRIPTGTELTTKKINRIEYAETLIQNITGLEMVRVRDDHGEARIEISDVDKLLNSSILNHINSELNAVGFKKVLLDVTAYGDSDKELVIYKPCQDEADKIMFETELPYQIDIQETCHQLENLGEVKCSTKMGVAMVDLDESNITIFGKGKIVARRVKDKVTAQELMTRVLPLIRRVI